MQFQTKLRHARIADAILLGPFVRRLYGKLYPQTSKYLIFNVNNIYFSAFLSSNCHHARLECRLDKPEH